MLKNIGQLVQATFIVLVLGVLVFLLTPVPQDDDDISDIENSLSVQSEIQNLNKGIDEGDGFSMGNFSTQRHVSEDKVQNLIKDVPYIKNKIILSEAPDGEIELIDGHHRLTVMGRSGKTHLTTGEYVLLYSDKSKNRFNLEIKNGSFAKIIHHRYDAES